MNVLHYLKYFLFHAVGLLAATSILAGGAYMSAGFLLILAIYVVGDALCGDDTSTPQLKHPAILTVQLWLALPLLAFILFCALWSFSGGDALGFGAALTHLSGYDLIAARDASAARHYLSVVLNCILMIGLIGTIPGHELTHRTWDRCPC